MRFRSRADRRPRWGVAAAVLLIHVVLVAGLVRAFTPELAARAVNAVTQAFTIEAVPPPEPEPLPEPSATSRPHPAPEKEAAAGAPGRKATPREIAAPRAELVITPTQAPPVAGPGNEDAAGAAPRGAGTGASGTGEGLGAGSAGTGTGGGGRAAPTVKIAGDINSARDYPRATRQARIGAFVVVELVVGTDGLVRSCRIVRPSPDPEADAITCTLAARRFRFRPARDAAGNITQAIYHWRQRWFY